MAIFGGTTTIPRPVVAVGLADHPKNLAESCSRTARRVDRAGRDRGRSSGLPIPLTAGRLRALQKLKLICRSMLRLAAGEEKKPPDKALDLSNRGDSSTPTGCARFTLLKTFLAIAPRVSE